MSAIDEAIDRLELDLGDDWKALPEDVQVVIDEVRRLTTAPVAALEQLRATADDLPMGTDERYQQGYRAALSDALTATMRGAMRAGGVDLCLICESAHRNQGRDLRRDRSHDPHHPPMRRSRLHRAVSCDAADVRSTLEHGPEHDRSTHLSQLSTRADALYGQRSVHLCSKGRHTSCCSARGGAVVSAEEPLYCPLCGAEDYDCEHTCAEREARPALYCEVTGCCFANGESCDYCVSPYDNQEREGVRS